MTETAVYADYTSPNVTTIDLKHKNTRESVLFDRFK